MMHVTEQELAAYLVDPQPGGVETHVAACAECRDRLAGEAAIELELRAVAQACLECGRAVDDASCTYCGALRRLAGYTLEAILVHHARGRLYRARDASGRTVAIKELVFAHAPGLEAVEAFEREAAFLRTLSHPAIPRFVASFTTGDGVGTRMYLVQDFVDGDSLAQRLRIYRFTDAELVAIARRVLGILVYLQSTTPMVFHRDVKPANLIARVDGSIALVDFGAARDRGATVNATVAGTFGYMPLEQLVGIVDATSDLFSLGMSLWHLATRVDPWQIDEQIKRKAHVSRTTRAFLDKLTARDPKQRFATAADALRALDGRPRRSVPIVPLSIAALVAIGGVFGAAVALATGPEPDERREIAIVRVRIPPGITAAVYVDHAAVPAYPAVADRQPLAIGAGHRNVRIDSEAGNRNVALDLAAATTTTVECNNRIAVPPPPPPKRPAACEAYARAFAKLQDCRQLNPVTSLVIEDPDPTMDEPACRAGLREIHDALAAAGCLMDVADVRARADATYRARQFGEAAKILRDALPKLSDRDAMGLRTIAHEYERIGEAFARGPIADDDAYTVLETAIAYDRNVGGVFVDELRAKLGAIAPKFATLAFGKGRYELAFQACETADASGNGGSTTDLIRKALEHKADDIYKSAMAEPDATKAKHQLARIRNMVRSDAPIVATAQAAINAR